MLSDLKFGFRSLLRTPGFTVVALVTLALGIGLNTAMFNIVNSLVLQPLKFPDSASLFRLERIDAQRQAGGNRPAHFIEIERESRDFARVACFRPWSFTLAEPNRPAEVLNSLRASAGYFSILGLNMEMGREFLHEEDTPGRNQVIILSYNFWRTHFNGDPKIIGRTVRVDGQPNVIIGVAPAMANDPRALNSAEIYRPLALTAEEIADRVDHAYGMIGRYLPGLTAVQAAPRFNAIATALTVIDQKEYEGRTLRAVSLLPDLKGTGRQITYMLISLSTFVLLIACANLANLLMARAIARAREFAIRGALGASRAQLIRPLLAECGLLAATGGALGLLVSVWTNDWMARQFSASGSELNFVLDWHLMLFAFGTALFTGIFFGVAPAWLISNVRVNDALKSGTRGSTGDRSQNRFRQMLIVTQFALALVLLSGAVFFVRGLDQLLHRSAGWNPTPMLRGILSLPAARYPDTERMMQFYEKVQQRVSALPGVSAAAISYDVPAFGFPSGNGFIVEGQPPPASGNELGAPINGVTPGYFDTMGTHVLRGRNFSPTDRSNSPHVIIINETMARVLFPGGDAVGRRLAYDEKNPVWMEIIGVVEDVHFLNLGNASATFQTYIPLSQSTWSYVALSVRCGVPPATLLKSIRAAVNELDPDLAVKELMPVTAFIRRSMADVQAINQLLVGFALLGLFLAALGIYSVIARLVAQRTTEIGIRMALGAQVGDIARLILGAGMRPVLGGALLGLIGAIGLSRFLNSTMPGLAASGFASITIAGFVLILLALVACWLPARRATKVDPMVALRAE